MTESYPYADEARGARIIDKFQQVCQNYGLVVKETTVDFAAASDRIIDLYQRTRPDCNARDLVSDCQQAVNFRAVVLYHASDPERLVGLCAVKTPTTADINGEAERLICNAQRQLGIPLANRVYCRDLAVTPEFQGLGIASGLAWTARNLWRQAEGTITLSRIRPNNRASMFAATEMGQASLGIYDTTTDKYIWWGVIPPTN
ncbi:MAG TPA: GNAT family N-acetyltransferase [Candidatus Saccharimonas sp.]|nr:GNAT family N-acetyltransferase [Candidatus Saccharimonas sp.]